jgi:formate-dependent nitrite reductase membrane component NrfD
VLLAHMVMEFLSLPGAARRLAWIGAPAALLTAAYTGYLFAQAKARDLWQNPLAPLHLVVQALIAGAAVLLLLTALPHASDSRVFAWLLLLACSAHLQLVLAEHTLTHVTAHARLAAWEMTRGSYARWFWAGVLLAAIGVAAPWLGPIASAPALLGLFAYEHSYVQAGQGVPLA